MDDFLKDLEDLEIKRNAEQRRIGPLMDDFLKDLEILRNAEQMEIATIELAQVTTKLFNEMCNAGMPHDYAYKFTMGIIAEMIAKKA